MKDWCHQLLFQGQIFYVVLGVSKPLKAIYVSPKSRKLDVQDPLIVGIHGDPHSVLPASFSKSLSFLSSLGYSLLIVNYRSFLGFIEEALQSFTRKIMSRDVIPILTTLDYVNDKKLADPSKICVLGGSSDEILMRYFIGQVEWCFPLLHSLTLIICSCTEKLRSSKLKV
ncbi:hypothetical protein C2S53_002780 [Perilla frutescens var. hirtella]|uniref:Uncharacterized protein n=1 Tax=Perilla frutescens var. hirtella TaxID=608512 RepID=A0AAD4IQP8_PERFH|nr:hypothetical protein C2S53_002780 [Perilla frutescens var. hirtella]